MICLEPLEPNGNEQRSQGSDRIETPLPAPKNVQNQGECFMIPLLLIK